MKTIIAILLAGSLSQAYGTRFSTGKGISCQANFVAVPLFEVSGKCKPRVTSETVMPYGSGTDYLGQKFITVSRSVSGTKCVLNALMLDMVPGVGDLALPFEQTLNQVKEKRYYGSFVQIEKGNNYVTPEEHRHLRVYVNYKADDATIEQDHNSLISVQNVVLLDNVTINYNNAAKTLTASIASKNISLTEPADFSAGTKRSVVEFKIPLNSYNLPRDREYQMNVFCSPVSAKK